MEAFLFILAALMAVAAFALHRNADKSERKFANRPAVVTNPAKDLLTNQKYAIVKFLALVQGASPLSAFSDEANAIVQSTIQSLGLSRPEVERIVKVSMTHDPERELNRTLDSLAEIRDRNYLGDVFRKAMRIAQISQDTETIEGVRHVMNELGL